MARLVEATADLVGASVVLEDLSRRVLVAAAREEPVDRLLVDWERRSRLTPYLRESGSGGPERWLTTPVGIQGGAWGRLVQPSGRRGARAVRVLERAAQAVELGRMIDRDDTSIQLRVHGGFLLDLLDDRLGTEAVAAARLRALGVADGTAYVGAVARLRDEPSGDADAAQRRMVRLSESVHAALGASRCIGPGRRPRRRPRRDPGRRRRRARRRRAASWPRWSPTRCSARDSRSTGCSPRAGSLRSARVVADVAASMPPTAGCVRQADIRLPGLLMSLREDARLQEFAEAELGRLLEHEARYGGGLVTLLRQFLAVGGNKAELARVAHRNRTSLYPALRRLEELVGHPLDDPASRLSLGVALLAYDQGREL